MSNFYPLENFNEITIVLLGPYIYGFKHLLVNRNITKFDKKIGRYLANQSTSILEMSIFHDYLYFSSFEAGSNSSFK